MDAAWVFWMTLALLLVQSDGLTLRTTGAESPQSTQLRLMTKAEGDALQRRVPAIRENEIAAIFRGVAYGAPTQGRPNDSSTVQVTTETIIFNFPSTSSTSSFRSAVSTLGPPKFASEVPVSHGNHRDNDRQVTLHNHTSNFKDIREIPQAIDTSEGQGTKEGPVNNDILVVPTYVPLATSHTALDISRRPENNGKGSRIDGSNNKGVWISGFPNSLDGIAWSIHVYVSVGLFTLLGLVSLCLMARVALCTHLLPRTHYLSLHIFIFCASFVRSLDILLESHDMKYLFPITITMVAGEFGWPCLTAALAVLLIAVLKEWQHPNHPHRALVLYLFTGLHLVALPIAHFSVLWLEQDNIPVVVIIRAFSTGWGGAIGIGGMWAVWRESRDNSSHMTGVQSNNNVRNHPNISHPARLVLTAALTQLLLAGLHLYSLLVPNSPETHAWIWWSCVTVSRGLELIVGSTLLTAAALTLTRQSPCNVFSSCCQKRTVEIVHPAEIKMIHPMGVYTLQPARPKNEHAQTIAALSLSNSYKEKRDQSSLDYVTSDFQLVWSHSRQRPLGASQNTQHLLGDDGVLQSCTDKPFNDLPNAHILTHKPRIGVIDPFLGPSAFTAVVPRNRMYVDPQSCLPLQEDLKSSQDGGLNYASKSSTLLSGSSGSSKLYSSPQIPLRSSRSWDEISTGHIYEDLTKTKHGSVDEGLSDLSDLNSENMNDLFFSEAGSPVFIRPARKQQKRNYAACYIRANYLKQNSVPPLAIMSQHRDSGGIFQPDPSQTVESHKKPIELSGNKLNSTQRSITKQNSTQVSSSRQMSSQNPLNEFCPDIIPTNSKIAPLPDLPTTHNSSQHVAIHTPSTRTTSMNQLPSGSTKPRGKL
ncbi:uncharacterized protein LOC135195085 [Macrobrachium nipponense]|uniref:uncharacterized protein LOC135195085 n=1 Tax=Macrobrachium nipponense TaxID=159736 RepID=UPI0030C8ADDE